MTTLPGPPGRLRTTLRLIRDPRGALEDWSRRYGDPFLIHALNGPVVITGREDLIAQIFSADPMQYDAFAQQSMVPMLGSGSMLMLSGEAHRRERKLVMPMFHGQRMRAYADVMQQSTLARLNQLKPGETFSMLDLATEISLDVIVRAVFGAERPERVLRLVGLAKELVRRSHPLLFFSPKTHLPFLGLSPWDRFRQAQTTLRDELDREIDHRSGSEESREDILTLLSQATYENGQPIDREHLKDELGTFLFAGHETSALAITWAIEHLHRNPSTLRRLREDLGTLGDDAPDAIASQPYLKAVVQESLRMHPIVTEVLRVLKEPMSLDGHELPAGFAVAPATVLAHYNPSTYPDPDEFRPARFLDRRYGSNQFMPFGGGHRRCVGAAFATYEMAIVIGSLVMNSKMESLEPRPPQPKRRNITMGPCSGVDMRFVARLDPQVAASAD
ncbi:cytochrome P450 [Roseiconus nitratireducens]|uniref:Cytochrome P450 n=1 Tax=Roseiconus nitratireducens TaxID=2605748 RepID=A0A5M6DGK7_9BACT|nr:cytochrome P450 [Roseiconus nitratireducens]KAA5545339.1 cytochrome P450 [Roseiconus nitratireducens]